MSSSGQILEKRSFRLLPDDEIGFAKPAIEYETPGGQVKVKVCHDFKAPEPELARRPGDPGYWTLNVWLPVGSVPRRMLPDPSAPAL